MKSVYKPKRFFKPTKLFKKWIGIVLLAILFALFMQQNILAATQNPVPKLKLNVGDVLHYQLDEIDFRQLDTVQSTTLIDFEVIGKKDSLYTLVSKIRQKESITNNSYTNSQYYIDDKFGSLELKYSLPFLLSDKGVVQPVVIPDTLISRIIESEYGSQYAKTRYLFSNLESIQVNLKQYFQQFFVDWNIAEQGKFSTTNKFGEYQLDCSDISSGKDFSHLYIGSTFQPYDTIPEPIKEIGDSLISARPISEDDSIDLTYYNLRSGIATEPNFGTWNKIISSVKTKVSNGTVISKEDTLIRTKPTKNKLFVKENESLNSYRKIQQKTKFASTVIITGTLDSECIAQDLTCFSRIHFFYSPEILLDEKIAPGSDFDFKIATEKSLSITLNLKEWLNNEYGNFLIEPGDSIHLTITPGGVKFSGIGALKNNLYKELLNNKLNLRACKSNSIARDLANKWISEQELKLISFKDQLSLWAYNEIRCDLYYIAMLELYSYSFHKYRYNQASINFLFDDLKWMEHISFTSANLNSYILVYLSTKLYFLSNNYGGIASQKYYLADIIFENEMKCIAQALSIFQTLEIEPIDEVRRLLKQFEEDYSESFYCKIINQKLQSRADIGNGMPFSEFEVKDINGRMVKTKSFIGKYVQILFINLEKEQERILLAQYQVLKKLPKHKFELITVFVNENDSLTNEYIRKRNPKGILIKNPGWKIEGLRKYQISSKPSLYLVSPKGILLKGSSDNPLIDLNFPGSTYELIHNDIYNKEEASISKKTLYWVLSISVFSILLILGVVIVVAKNIKRKEANRREQVELKLGAVRSQLNPHFLFNAMTSIQYLVNHNENEKANLFLSKFAQLMRKILFQSEIDRVPIKDELETIETYLELEALRHRFNYHINVDDGIDIHNTEIPVMLLQPFVENAVIHGIAHLAEKGTIEIKVEKVLNNRLKISIIDNGQGYTNAEIKKTGSNGKGMQITQKRIDLMMAKHGNEISFKLHNRSDLDNSKTGTQVEIIVETEA